MKRMFVVSVMTFLIGSLVCLSLINVQADEKDDALQFKSQRKAAFPFYVYKDKLARGNHYTASGWMGDYGAVRLNDSWSQEPYEGKTCMKWTYDGESTQGAGWAGVFWQNPANNWGRIKGGYDLTGASRLSFWVKGDKGGEVVEFKVGGIMGEYSDSIEKTTGPLTLTRDWKKYNIDLSLSDLSYIGGGFCWVSSSIDAPEGGIVFYVDEVVYLK